MQCQEFRFVLFSLIFFYWGIASARDPFPELPPGKNREVVIANCVSCHSPKLIAQNRLSRKDWDQAITWMQKNHNLWQIEPKKRNLILDYLTKNFSPTETYRTEGYGPRRTNPLPEKIIQK